MRKVIRYNKQPDMYILNIQIELGYSDDPSNSEMKAVAASEDYIHRNKLKKEYQLTDDQISELNNLIHEVIRVISDHNFNILGQGQSNKSYTYYIRFIPEDAIVPFQIQFEIRDHMIKGHPTEGMLSPRIIVKAFYIGDKTCFNIDGVLREIERICDEISNGDYSSLNQVKTGGN